MLPLVLLLLLQASPEGVVVNGNGGPRVTIPRIEGAIAIDGALDEEPWRQAVRLGGFSQYQPSDSRPAEENTEVLVWYSPEAIYFGIVAHDRQPSSIRATVADRDNLDRDDSITIYLDTFNDRRRAFVFAVNPLGSQLDGVQNEGQFNPGTFSGMGTGGGAGLDKSPDYRFDSKGRLTPEGYVVEVRIPFKSLRYPGSGPQAWGLNVKRKIQRTGYEDTWTDAKRVASFLAQSGTIDGLHDLKRGMVTEAQPFVTASSAGTRRPSGDFTRAAADLNAGANLRFGFTNLSIDATLKPDFSQVESDAGLVTLNQRFALFIPEKRPFFLEGIELFATPNQLVYTRQVVQPLTGGKITGKFGAFGLAHLTAVDDVEGDNVVFNVTRVRRDLGRNSVAGVTFTDRTGRGGFNRVLAADTRVVFGGLYYVLGQVGQSWTEGASETLSSPIWTAEFDRTARHWGFNYKLNGIGRDFVTRSGFVPRSNIVEFRAMNRLTTYGRRGAFLESASVFFGPNRIWRHEEFGRESPIEGNESATVSMNIRGGWSLSNAVRREFVRFDPVMYAGYSAFDGSAYAHPEKVSGYFGWTSSVTSPTWQKMNARVESFRGGVAIFPEATAGHERRVSVTAGVRPTTSIRIDLSAVRSTIYRDRDDSEFARTTLPRLKMEYQPRRSLFFRVVGEYRAQRQAALLHAVTAEPLYIGGLPAVAQEQNGLRLDWLASYEPTPGTAAYFGYGSSLDAPDAFAFSDLRRSSDGFFLKLAYQIRR